MTDHSRNGPGFVYFVRFGMDGDGPIKIGHAVNPLARIDRARKHFIGKGATEARFTLLYFVPGDERAEARLHHHFRPWQLIGDWFDAPPILSFIQRLQKVGL